MVRQPVIIENHPAERRPSERTPMPWSGWFPFMNLEVVYAEARLEGDRIHLRGARTTYRGDTVTEESFQGEADAGEMAEHIVTLQQQMLSRVADMQRRMLGMMFPWLPWSR